jgi:hypothetical protein
MAVPKKYIAELRAIIAAHVPAPARAALAAELRATAAYQGHASFRETIIRLFPFPPGQGAAGFGATSDRLASKRRKFAKAERQREAAIRREDATWRQYAAGAPGGSTLTGLRDAAVGGRLAKVSGGLPSLGKR